MADPANLLPGGTGARAALFPEGFQAPPHGILLSLFLGCGGRTFGGRVSAPCCPGASSSRGPRWSCPREAAGPEQETGESTGMRLPSCHHHTPPGAALEPWADPRRCPLEGYCFADPQCLGPTVTFPARCRAPRCALSWALCSRRGSGTLCICSLWLPTLRFQCPWTLGGVLERRQEGRRGLL